MKANDVFANEMQTRGPEASPFIFWPAACAAIRGKRVEPHIEDGRRLAWDWKAPTNRGARDAEVFQTTFDETDDFVPPRFGLDEVGILPVKIEQRLLKGRKLKEVVFFSDCFRGAAAIGAVVTGRCVGHKGIVIDAVLA